MATKSTKNPPREYTVGERLKISKAREDIKTAQGVLASLGASVDIESDNPMDDVSYERRNCRMKALDLAVANNANSGVLEMPESVVERAGRFYDYIWKGEVDAAV